MQPIARRVTAAVALVTIGLASVGCTSQTSSGAGGDVVAVASTDVWGSIAATIGGPHVEVTWFISSPGQDPHSFEASTRDVLSVSKADVVIENGGGYDVFMDQLLRAVDTEPTVLNAVDLSGVSAGSSGTLNEHIWYRLEAAKKMAAAIANAFGTADAAHAQRYLSNARTFTSSVDALMAREAAMRRRLGGVAVAVTEPVPLYMLEAIGAVDRTPQQFSAAVEQGQDVSVSVLDETLGLFTSHRVAALVYNEQTSGPLTEQVRTAAEDSGIPVVAVTETLPDGVDYLTWMSDNLDALAKALSGP